MCALLNRPNIFADSTALATKHKAANLGQGFPSYGPPEFLMSYLRNASSLSDWKGQQNQRPWMGEAKTNGSQQGGFCLSDELPSGGYLYQYSTPGGSFALRDVIARHYGQRMGYESSDGSACMGPDMYDISPHSCSPCAFMSVDSAYPWRVGDPTHHPSLLTAVVSQGGSKTTRCLVDKRWGRGDCGGAGGHVHNSIGVDKPRRHGGSDRTGL